VTERGLGEGFEEETGREKGCDKKRGG